MSDNISSTCRIELKEFTPIRTASPAPAQDRNVLVGRASSGGSTISFDVRIYAIPMKSGKKNGGPTYHRVYSLDFPIPAGTTKLRISAMGQNSSTGNEQMARDAIVALDEGTYKARDTNFITIGDALHQVKLEDLREPESALRTLLQNIRRHFANADGPIFYASLLVDDWATRPAGLIQNKVNASLGLTNNSAYEFEWTVSKV